MTCIMLGELWMLGDIDPLLLNSSSLVCVTNVSQIRLSNNALVPWLLIIPKTNETEWFKLSVEMQASLNEQVNKLSHILRVSLNCSKINIATIGNVVNQMHIHVVGRNEDDYCWPGVVWSESACSDYKPDDKKNIIDLVCRSFGNS